MPKGSARAYTYKRKPEKGGGLGARVEMDTKESRQWQKDVAKIAAFRRRGFFCDGAVRLTIVFFMPRPKYLKDRMDPHVVRPDLDKLARCVLDALTDVCWRDDSQVTELHTIKRYASPRSEPCATIRVVALDVEQQSLLQKGA